MIYLASPYSDPDPAVRQERYEAAVEAAAELWKAGVVVFSPTAHSHPIALHGVAGSWEQWSEFDERILAVCLEVWVLMIDGWRESRGIVAEVGIARRLGLPVRHLEPSDIALLCSHGNGLRGSR